MAALMVADVYVAIEQAPDVAIAGLRARELAQRLAFPELAAEALATAVSEVARNIVIHAVGGELTLQAACEDDRWGIVVVARDRGPGLPDPALEDGYTTGSGLGLGLSSARRLVDELEVSSTMSTGTVVVLKKWLR